MYYSQTLVHDFFFLTPNIPIFFTHFSGGRFCHPKISVWLLVYFGTLSIFGEQ
jgi:hypothetical protein